MMQPEAYGAALCDRVFFVRVNLSGTVRAKGMELAIEPHQPVAGLVMTNLSDLAIKHAVTAHFMAGG